MAIPNLDVFQVIADPSRREILQLLTKDSYNINSISENFEMSRPAVSKHIKILQTAGFVTINKVGREHYCMLNQEGFDAIRNWITHFDKFWNNKLKNLETLLNSQKTNN
ncbi:ArsR/SmtB family transcription factor [Flavobacterium aestivum]|uniref:ArsR/SmtB family transcription factor n=1 Tax=Flavobacterium aestivum TaxID=3003257 RepID=UPI0024825A86|nr:metalloregulator ArsR/SmtB family transcription factor [Flavobacterium aestivum]